MEPRPRLEEAAFVARGWPSSPMNERAPECLLALRHERVVWQVQREAARLAQSQPPVAELVDERAG